MRVVLKYTREERVKYISHLDLMRAMQRAVRRADIPVAYSQGFNPHPIMAFASPLPVGVTSQAEYMDIVLEQPMSLPVLRERLNHALPKGIGILDAAVVDDKAPSLMSMVERADYRVTVHGFDWHQVLDAYNERTEILVEKRTKRKVTSVNLKDSIYSLQPDKESRDILYLSLSIGKKGSLPPGAVAEALLKLPEQNDKENGSMVFIHRIGLYCRINGQWTTPLSMKRN